MLRVFASTVDVRVTVADDHATVLVVIVKDPAPSLFLVAPKLIKLQLRSPQRGVQLVLLNVARELSSTWVCRRASKSRCGESSRCQRGML
jgi:hypothetical protein